MARDRKNNIKPAGPDMDVCWHSTLSRPHGYAMISRSMVLALWAAGVNLSYEYLYGPGTVFPVSEEKDLGDERLNALARKKCKKDGTHVVFGQGDAFEYVKSGVVRSSYRVGYSMLEVSGLPEEWVRQANEMDEIWTPSPFNVRTFRDSGVKTPICVMPLGVDTENFDPTVDGFSPEDIFTFLSIFEWGERKAPEILLKAFNETFTRDEPVVLVCKYDNYDEAVEVIIDIDGMDLDPEGGQIVFVANQHVPYGELAQMYRSADCFVLPTRGEGWGMPILEAMACGIPVIATYWSAQQTFMTQANSYPLQVSKLVKARAKCPYYKGFKWAEPDTGHLKSLLRHVYENPQEARQKGERAAADAREKWSLQMCERNIHGRLTEIAEERSTNGRSQATWIPEGVFKPRIGIDISRAVGEPITGVGRSCLTMLKCLADMPDDVNRFEYLLLPGLGDFVHPHYLEKYSFDGVDDPRFTLYRGPLPAFSSGEHYVPGLDLVHSTAYMKPDTEDVPLLVTVHDLTFLTHPYYHTLENVDFCVGNMNRAIASDCHFIAVSENTRKDMIEHYGIDSERISVVYNSIESDEFKRLPATAVREALAKYELPERFFLSVGSLEPRKNLETVIAAMRQYDGPEPLIIAGASGWKNDEVYAAIEENSEKIRLVGYVPQEELPLFYNAALATVYPSFYEGFGLPILESMACGTPVITSNNSSIPEVAGEACILIDDPSDPAAIATAMKDLSGDELKRERMSKEGLVQARKFSSANAATSLLKVYAKLLGTTI